MNLKRARYISAIYEAGGITAAARRLFVSQPSLSQTVRLVEQELGTAIFERGVTPPKLTYAGEIYLETAKAMIAQEERLNGILENIRNEERGRMHLGISIQRGMQLLPLVLPEFSSRYPHVQLLLEEYGSARLEKLVEEGAIDLALVTTEPAISSLKYELIETESYVLLTGRSNPLAERYRPGAVISLSEVADGRFVALKPGHNVRVIHDRIFARHSVTPNILVETDSIEAAIRVTVACGCYMLCPQGFVRGDPAIAGAGICYRLEELTEERHFYACCQREKYLPGYVHAFVKMVREATQKSRTQVGRGAAGA